MRLASVVALAALLFWGLVAAHTGAQDKGGAKSPKAGLEAFPLLKKKVEKGEVKAFAGVVSSILATDNYFAFAVSNKKDGTKGFLTTTFPRHELIEKAVFLGLEKQLPVTVYSTTKGSEVYAVVVSGPAPKER